MLKITVAALALLLAGPALAAGDTTKPDAPPKVLTADEGRSLYKLGLTEGAARAALQQAQTEAKDALDVLTPKPPAPKPAPAAPPTK